MGEYQSAGGEGSRGMFPAKLEEASGHVIHRLGQDISLHPRGLLSSLSIHGMGTGFKSRNIKLDSRFGSGLPFLYMTRQSSCSVVRGKEHFPESTGMCILEMHRNSTVWALCMGVYVLGGLV